MLARRTGSSAARSLFVWFVSPRLATRTALRLAATTPGIHVWLPATPGHGAEGPVTLLGAQVPAERCAEVSRLLADLGVPLLWDPLSGDPRPGHRPPTPG